MEETIEVKADAPKGKDLTSEAWREYDWFPPGGKERVTYRISDPVALFVGNTTHRVVDSKQVVHCVPNVGHMGCALRWKARPGKPIVSF